MSKAPIPNTSQVQRYLEFVAGLREIPPVETEFKVGQRVAYVNDYGAALAATGTESVAAEIDSVFPPAENLVFVLLGDAAAIREQASAYGTLIEVSIAEPHFRQQDDAGEQ